MFGAVLLLEQGNEDDNDNDHSKDSVAAVPCLAICVLPPCFLVTVPTTVACVIHNAFLLRVGGSLFGLPRSRVLSPLVFHCYSCSFSVKQRGLSGQKFFHTSKHGRALRLLFDLGFLRVQHLLDMIKRGCLLGLLFKGIHDAQQLLKDVLCRAGEIGPMGGAKSKQRDDSYNRDHSLHLPVGIAHCVDRDDDKGSAKKGQTPQYDLAMVFQRIRHDIPLLPNL